MIALLFQVFPIALFAAGVKLGMFPEKEGSIFRCLVRYQPLEQEGYTTFNLNLEYHIPKQLSQRYQGLQIHQNYCLFFLNLKPTNRLRQNSNQLLVKQ